MADSISNPPTVHRSSLFSTSSPTLTFSPLDDGHSSRYEMISHWRFDLCFPDNWWYWAFFLTCWLFVWLPQKIVYSVPLSIFKLHSLGFFFHCYWVLWFLWLLTVYYLQISSHIFWGDFSFCWLFLLLCWTLKFNVGFPGGSVVKNTPASAGDVGSIPGLERTPGEKNGNLLRYSCLGNLMDRGAWWATVHASRKSQTRLTD